nr:6-pyruvoyl-tetrahydropterin synthase-related protein [Syntrophomonas palmitatica]
MAIGKHASIYAIQFPEIEISQTTKIDDYSLEQLSKYKMLILAGSSWNAQAQAEKLIVQYAQSGGKVLVDLTGFEPDVLARQPKFLGIYGEPISAKDNLEIYSENEKIILEPFDGNDWRCIAPQGLDGSIYQFSHYGNEAVLLGYKKINSSQRIYFLGANLAYHSFITHDPNAMKILNRVLHPQIYYKKPQVYLLKNYSYNSNGYNMSYYTNETTPVIVPIAALEGMKVKLDDKPKSMSITENLPTIVIPSGTHKIEFYLEKAPVFIAGRWITVICILIIIGGLILTFYRRIKADRNEMQISTTNI